MPLVGTDARWAFTTLVTRSSTNGYDARLLGNRDYCRRHLAPNRAALLFLPKARSKLEATLQRPTVGKNDCLDRRNCGRAIMFALALDASHIVAV